MSADRGRRSAGEGGSSALVTRSWDRETAAAALREYARRTGRHPTYNAWQRTPPGTPARSRLIALFGSWREAMRAAGFPAYGPGEGNKDVPPPGPCGRPGCYRERRGADPRCSRCVKYQERVGDEWVPHPVRRARLRRRNRAAVLDEILRLVEELGRPPSWYDYNGIYSGRGCLGRPSPSNWFGSWSAALSAAGYGPRAPYTRRSPEEAARRASGRRLGVAVRSPGEARGPLSRR